jgi:hypothetical protein
VVNSRDLSDLSNPAFSDLNNHHRLARHSPVHNLVFSDHNNRLSHLNLVPLNRALNNPASNDPSNLHKLVLLNQVHSNHKHALNFRQRVQGEV